MSTNFGGTSPISIPGNRRWEYLIWIAAGMSLAMLAASFLNPLIRLSACASRLHGLVNDCHLRSLMFRARLR